MEVFSNTFVVIFIVHVVAVAVAIAIYMANKSDKNTTVYDKHLHSKPRDGDNT